MRFTRAALARALVALCLAGPAAAEVTITSLANQGVLVSDGETRVMVDGLVVEPYALYAGLTPEAAGLFERMQGPFADVDLVLVSHRHHEHNQPAHACRFMEKSADARLVTSRQVIDLMREKCRAFINGNPRVRVIDPQPGEAVRLTQGGARVTVFPLSHGTRKFARIQHFGHLVELGGVTVLHVGDAAPDAAAFEQAGLGDVRVDVALVPYRYLEPGPGEALVRRFMDAPLKIAVHIPPDEYDEIATRLAERYPEVRVPAGPLETFTASASAAAP